MKLRPALHLLLPLVWLTLATGFGLCRAAPPVSSAPPQAPWLAPELMQRALGMASASAQALAPQGARVLVLPGALDARLNLAPCAAIEPFVPAGVPAWGRSRVGLRCASGPVAWQVFLPVTVQVWAPALVAQAPLAAGTRLDETLLAPSIVDWAAGAPPIAGPAGAAELQDRVLARPLAVGQPVRAGDLKQRQWFAPGDTVVVVALGAGFAISTEGLALGPGIEGQPTRVRTESGRVLTGQPVGQRRVELNL